MDYGIVRYEIGKTKKMGVKQLFVPRAMCLELYAGISEGLDTFRFLLKQRKGWCDQR